MYIATVVNLYAEASANWRATAGGDLAACAFDNTKASTKRMCESLTPQLAPSDKVEYNSASTEVPDGQGEGLYAQVGVWAYVPYPKVNVNAGIAFPGSDQAEKCLGLTLGVQWHKDWTGSMVNLAASKTFNVLGRDAEPNRLPIPPTGGIYTESAARAYCSALGSDWSVQYTDISGGSLYCLKDGTITNSNCNDCDTYRIVVWKDGGGETKHDSGSYPFQTKAGNVYSGHDPCRNGSDSLGRTCHTPED